MRVQLRPSIRRNAINTRLAIDRIRSRTTKYNRANVSAIQMAMSVAWWAGTVWPWETRPNGSSPIESNETVLLIIEWNGITSGSTTAQPAAAR